MPSAVELFGLNLLKVPASWPEATLLAALVVATFFLARRSMGPAGALGLSACSGMSFFIVGNVSVALALAVVAAIAAARGFRLKDTKEAGHSSPLSEVAIVGGGLIVYELARLTTGSSYELASVNAERIVRFERSIGLFFEGSLQSFVLRADVITHAFNFLYTYSFLVFVIGVLFWLMLADRDNYQLLRNSLGVSAILAVVTIALFPLAPPRLMPEFGILDSVVVMGREHGFANEFAAMPSLHVGWMVLAGYALGRSIGGRLGWLVGATPAGVMALTVIVSGNHYWIDGVIGIALSMALPATLALRRPLEAAGGRVTIATQRTADVLAHSRSAQFTSLALVTLLTYLVVGQVVAPGFTDFWGYLVLQMAVTLGLLLAGEVVFADQGGLSWPTHVIAVSAGYLDVLGTDGDLYARIDEYDKLTHFAGVAAVTSGVYDCFRAMNIRRGGTWPAGERYVLAMAIGMTTGVGWEMWELIGDKVFNTSRIGGAWDTTNDLLLDGLGALGAGTLLWWVEVTGRQRQPAKLPTEGAWREAPGPGGGGGGGGGAR